MLPIYVLENHEFNRNIGVLLNSTVIFQRPLVQLALETGSILLQYPTRIELWTLGSTSETSGG